jgi:A1 cistron-splicing factor AAR2
LRYFKPRERVILHYDPSIEEISPLVSSDQNEVISDDRLKALDTELAAYPFEGFNQWQSLTNYISEKVISQVLSPEGRIDGLMQVQGDVGDEDKGMQALYQAGLKARNPSSGEESLRFVQFDLKRSWRAGASGEEITKYAKDKSYLLGHLIGDKGKSSISLSKWRAEEVPVGVDVWGLLGQLQLAFVLLLNLSSYPCLSLYKRLLPAFTRSASFIAGPQPDIIPRGTIYPALLTILAAQLLALPDGVFDTELPELDGWYLQELEMLRQNLVDGTTGSESTWQDNEVADLRRAWEKLRIATSEKWRWDLGMLSPRIMNDSIGEEIDEEEKGEYAPVVVDM